MDKPEIKECLNGFDFTWPEYTLTVQARRIQEHNGAKIEGELSVITGKNGKNIVIYPPSSFNFTSDRTRVSIAKTLQAKTKIAQTEFDWQTAIDMIAFGVQDRVRKGEEVQDLPCNATITKPSWLLEPILMEGLPTVIFGEKGVCKSTLALVSYVCLSEQWVDNPLDWKVTDRKIPTLYLDWELPGKIAQAKANDLQRGMGIEPFILFHRRCSRSLADDIEQISTQIDRIGAEVVIIDSLARACGGELRETEPANKFFEALDKLKVTSLIIAQTSKDRESKTKTIYGNALFTYYARSIFELCRSDFSSDDTTDVGLFHRWSNLSRRQPDQQIRFTFSELDDTITVEKIPMDVGQFIEKVDLQGAILSILKDGALSIEDIAAAAGAKNTSVRATLTKLKRKDKVLNTERGMWGLRAEC